MRGLIFEGSILAYDPITNRAEWVPVCSTASNLSWEEEMLALALYDMVPRVPDEGHKEEDKDADGEDADEESESHTNSKSTQESPRSTCFYSDRHHHGTSWAQWCESENGEDGSFEELSVSENSKDERGGEAEHSQALLSSPLCEQESSGKLPEVVGWAAPSKTTSTAGNLPPTGSQDTIIIHAMEDELRSIE